MKKDPRNCMHYFEQLCQDTQRQAELLLETTKIHTSDAITQNKMLSDSLLEESNRKKLLLIKGLSKAFITPVDREDILMSALLSYKLSSMLNSIFSQIVSLNLTNLGDVFANTTSLLINSCQVINRLAKILALPYSENIIEKHIADMSKLRQDTQKLHLECVKKLFSDIRSPYELVVRQSVYEKIKECCDFSYDICDYFVCVIIKNT